MAVSEQPARTAGIAEPAAQGADDRRRLQDPPERVRRRLDLEDPLPRGPEAAQPAAHLRRLPPLQPVRRRTAADDPAPAARRVPAAAGDPPGAGRRRRPRARRRRAQAGQRRACGGRSWSTPRAPTSPSTRSIEETGAREELIARAGELRDRPAGETRGQDGLRRDRPRDRPRRQRALAGRRRRPQPARLPLLGRPRGAAAGSAARPLAALAQPRAPQGGAAEPGKPGGDGQPPQAPAAGPGPAPPRRRLTPGAAMPAVTRRRTIAAPVAGGLEARLRPLQPAALVAADEPGRERRAQGRRPAQPVDEGAGDRRGPRGARRLPLPQLGRERALRLGAGARGHAVRAPPAQLADRDRAAAASGEAPRSSSPRCRR